MNTDLRKKNKNNFEKETVFGKTMENLKNIDMKLVTTKRRRNYLVSEPNYHATKFFTEYLIAIEMRKKADTYE